MKAKLAAVFCSALSLLWGGDSFTVPAHPKFIKIGWDDPTVSFYAANVKMIEKALPHSGVRIMLDAVKDEAGKTIHPTYMMFTRKKLKREYFTDQIKSLKSVKSKKLTDNFLETRMLDAEKKFDLYDDAFWGGVCHNFNLLAAIAKEGGLKGLVVDMEDYWRLQNWKYRPEKGRSFREDYAKARQRGREFITAIGKAYENINLLFFFWLELEPAMNQHTPELLEKKLMISHTGLLSGFINGIYDKLPRNARIHDGMEEHCYIINNGQISYNRLRTIRANCYKRLIDPVNHAKLRAQTLFAPAIYVDSFIRPSGRYALKRKDMTPLEYFRSNAVLAAVNSDGYVWTFSEARKWYDIPYKKWQDERNKKVYPDYPGIYWEDSIPGICDAVAYAQNPYLTALDWASKGKLAKNNIAVNGDFSRNAQSQSDDNAPGVTSLKGVPGWGCWFPSDVKNASFQFSRTGGRNNSSCIKAVNVAKGTLLQNIKLKKGKTYLVRASFKGEGKPEMRIQWRNEKNAWCCSMENLFASFDEDMGDGWKRATQFICTPPSEACFFSVLISPAGKVPGECFIDDVEIFEI